MRLLWSLPKAAPAILRHIVAYAELAGQDLEQAQRDVVARLAAAAVLLVCVIFLLFSLCLLTVALTWDTPYRVQAIGVMSGGFFLIAVVAGLYGSKSAGSRTPFLGTVRREWAEDRIILDRILSEHD